MIFDGGELVFILLAFFSLIFLIAALFSDEPDLALFPFLGIVFFTVFAMASAQSHAHEIKTHAEIRKLYPQYEITDIDDPKRWPVGKVEYINKESSGNCTADLYYSGTKDRFFIVNPACA